MKELLEKLSKNNIHLSLIENELKVKFNGPGLSEDIVTELRDNKQMIIEYLRSIRQHEKFASIKRSIQKELYSLSSAQKRLYFLQEFVPETTGYNMPMVHPLGTNADKARLTNALNKLIERHEGLRTCFIKKDDSVHQRVLPTLTVAFDEYECYEEDFADLVNSYVRPFDLSQAPLLRSAIVKITDGGYMWVIDMHHIISDGTSHQILINDFFKLYEGATLPPLRLQYKDFSEWQNSMMERGELDKQKEYWLSQLAELPKLNFPADRPRPSVFTFEGSSHKFLIEGELASKLQKLGKKYQATLQMLLVSALNILLHKYTQQESFVLGCGIAGRRHVDVDQIVGMFVNSLVIKSNPQGHKTYEEFLKEIVSTSLAAYENQDVQFEDLVKLLNVERDPSRNPIFDISMIVQNFEQSRIDTSEIIQAGASSPQWKSDGGASKFDMTWFVHERSSEILIHVEYYSAIFDKSTIEQLGKHFINVLTSVVEHPQIPLSEIAIVDSNERDTILSQYVNGKAESFPVGESIQAIVERQCELSPTRNAVSDAEGSLTFQELNAASNQLARFLKSGLEIKPEAKVAILQSRDKKTVVSILGILKAGAAYVPLDFEHPEQRLLYMLNDSNVEVLLTDKDLVELANKLQWRAKKIKHIVCVDSDNIYSEMGILRNDLMKRDLWDHVGDTATDSISGGGWQSSYTGEYLSSLEMEEYCENVYQKLKEHLNPTIKVLEIGCSSGLTMFRIAPHVGKYYGTDLSSSILDKTESEAARLGHTNINLSCLPAHEIDEIEETDFDIVIVNSVVQCFDGHNYLGKVISKALGKTKQGGLLFFGDIMDSDKQDDLIADLTAYKEAHPQNKFQAKTDWSSELFVSRDYWNDLVLDDIGITQITCSDKIHTVANELTRFRYDALLKTGKPSNPKSNERVKYQYDMRAVGALESSNIAHECTGKSLAYIIYTSGSSGLPKGVQMEHGSVINFIFGLTKEVYNNYEGPLRLALLSPFIFDASIQQIFGALFNGHTVYVTPNDVKNSGKALWEFFIDNKIDVSDGTPSHLLLLTSNPNCQRGSVKHFITGGEFFPVSLAKLFYNQCLTFGYSPAISNVYGPTEACVNCTAFTFDASTNMEGTGITIGRPVPNTQLLILNDTNQLMPVGAYGEICVGGIQVARGYLNNDNLTSTRFIPNPFGNGNIYRTGDVGRWHANGRIEYVGRLDDQVKIRGYRIELGEIEKVLLAHSHVDSCVVTAHSTEDGDKQLVAYMVGKQQLQLSELRSFLIKVLPMYMLPTHFVQLPELPLNKNGKVAKKKLPDPFKLSLSSDQAYVAPSNQQEELIAGAWQEILGREKIGVNDNFFELGGHSLLAMKALPKLNLKLGVKLTIKNLFVYPTIAALYKFIQEQAVQETLDPAIDLITEASEEFELDHINDLPRYAENPKDVFITGGTGFVGIYLIKELLENTKATIHCLIRGKDLADGKNRIIEKLNSFEIDNPDYHDRIVPVLGDLSAPNFGILLEDYDRLTENIDFIYHVGAYMDFMSSYYQLKAYNVTANYEIVKLATTRKLKKILYTSTIAVFKGWDLRAENDSIDHERHLVSSGYSGSKWVGEKVMLKAIEAGLPVQIYRLGLISGDAKTGKMPRDQWFSKVLKSCYELGVYIDQFAIAFTPVDFVSKSIVKLSLEEGLEQKVFHLASSRNVAMEEFFVNAEDLDKAISKVSAMDWLSQLQKISETQPLPISPFVNFESQLINDAMLGKIKLSLKRKNNISSQITLKIVKKLGVTIPQRSNYIKKYLKNCL